MVISKEFVFDAAHRITSHPGKCRSLHGHTWRAKITVGGAVNSETGMVMDFYDLKTIGGMLFGAWDHSALLAEWDPLVKVCKEINSRLHVFPNEPTSENLVLEVRDHFCRFLPGGIDLILVEIAETPGCTAGIVMGGK